MGVDDDGMETMWEIGGRRGHDTMGTWKGRAWVEVTLCQCRLRSPAVRCTSSYRCARIGGTDEMIMGGLSSQDSSIIATRNVYI